MSKGYGLKTSGGAFHQTGKSYQTGYGFKLGSTLQKIAKHHVDTSHHGAIGNSLIHSLGENFKNGRHAGGLLNKHSIAYLKDFLHKQRIHLKPSHQNLIDYVKKHELKRIHMKDMFGAKWFQKGKKLTKALTEKVGGSFWTKLKGVAKKAGHNLGRFFAGKTKYKPSDLARDLSKVGKEISKVVALIPDPRAQAISKGLSIGSDVLKPVSGALKKSGRGNGMKKVGSRAQVWHNKAISSYRGETKDQLIKNRNGRIVNKKRSQSAQISYKKHPNRQMNFRKKKK